MDNQNGTGEEVEAGHIGYVQVKMTGRHDHASWMHRVRHHGDNYVNMNSNEYAGKHVRIVELDEDSNIVEGETLSCSCT